MSIVRIIDGTAGGTERINCSDTAVVLADSIKYKDGLSSNIVTKNKAQGLFITVEDFAARLGFDGVVPTPGNDQSELIVNAVARDFSGASAWTNVDINAYDESTDLTLTADAVDQYAELAVAEAPMTALHQYRVLIDIANIVGSWLLQDFTGAQNFATINANGTQNIYDFIVNSGLTGGFRLAAVTATASADFDNFSLKRIGLGHKMAVGDILGIKNWSSIDTLRHVNDIVGSNAVLQITPEY